MQKGRDAMVGFHTSNTGDILFYGVRYHRSIINTPPLFGLVIDRLNNRLNEPS